MREALYYSKLKNNAVKCTLCPNECVIASGKKGACLTRVNVNGDLVTENYGRVISLSMDPVEKKPLYHFYPGTNVLSTGPNGCNLKCQFCQNSSISQKISSVHKISPKDLVQLAKENNALGIAYTYTEPFIGFEYLIESSKIAHENNLKNILVTNGYVNIAPLKEILPYIDAMNIDIKSMDNNFYKNICGGDISPVLQTCEEVKKVCHLEITNLLITGLNDSVELISKLVKYIASNIGDDTPLHFSRYFPQYKMMVEQTPIESIKTAVSMGRDKLKYVYAGNVDIEDGSDTRCFSCGALLIKRDGYFVEKVNIKDGKCLICGREHNIVG